MYSELPIINRSDIAVNGNDIIKILNRKPDNYIKDIIDDVEKKILDNKINNVSSQLDTKANELQLKSLENNV